MNASTRLLKALLTRGESLERFTQSELKALIVIIDRANDEVVGLIASTSGDWTKDWLAAAKVDLDRIYGEAAKAVGEELTGRLKALADQEIAEAAETFTQLGVPYTTPNSANLWASIAALPAVEGATIQDLIDAFGVGSAKEVTAALQTGMAEGETVDQMVRRIRGRAVKPARWVNGKYVPGVYTGGVMETTTRGAEALVRTAVMHASNQARDMFYGENEDLFEGYQRVETLDARTCLVCQCDDGATYKVGEPRPTLPAHINCRGLYVPVLKSWKKLGFDMDELPPSTRASLDGQVPEYTTFKDLLAQKGKDFQDAALGPTRAAMYRNGVPLSAFVSEGKVIPLKDLVK